MFTGALQRACQVRGGGIATIFAGRQRTWQESTERTARLAAGLRTVGVGVDDRIGILGLNSDRYLEAMHATWWCGAITVPMNIRWALVEHVYSVNDADISTIFVDDHFIEVARKIADQCPQIKHLIYIGDATPPENFVDGEALIVTNGTIAPAVRSRHALAGIFYTGGTTGTPKGVMHSSLSLWAGATTLAVTSRTPDAPRYLHAAPMFHLGDLVGAFYTTALAGTHVIIPSFSPQAVCDAVREHHVQTTLLLPTMIGMLLEHPKFRPEDFASLGFLLYGGSPITEEIRRRIRAALPNVNLSQGFGQTETTACGTFMPDGETRHLDPEHPRQRSAGRALYGAEVRIVRESGIEASPGEVGEIWLKTPAAMLGYLNKPRETAEALTDDWVHTGDAGYLDDDGFLFVCDRVKDMIISGGENVFSAEVENAVASHPAVAQVAVIGVPDQTWGERVHAVITPKNLAKPTLEEIQAHCRPLIAGYKIPRSMELRETPLPLSPVGKVLKMVLRAPYWQGQERNVH